MGLPMNSLPWPIPQRSAAQMGNHSQLGPQRQSPIAVSLLQCRSSAFHLRALSRWRPMQMRPSQPQQMRHAGRTAMQQQQGMLRLSRPAWWQQQCLLSARAL